eukprot:scaffold601_cov170-Ochromonas_danica.AAC.57
MESTVLVELPLSCQFHQWNHPHTHTYTLQPHTPAHTLTTHHTTTHCHTDIQKNTCGAHAQPSHHSAPSLCQIPSAVPVGLGLRTTKLLSLHRTMSQL